MQIATRVYARRVPIDIISMRSFKCITSDISATIKDNTVKTNKVWSTDSAVNNC